MAPDTLHAAARGSNDTPDTATLRAEIRSLRHAIDEGFATARADYCYLLGLTLACFAAVLVVLLLRLVL